MAGAAQDTDERFIRDLLRTQFRREVTDLTRLDGGRNSLVYLTSIRGADTPGEEVKAPDRLKPGTAPLPPGPSELVVRLSDPTAMLNEEVRVQNEVATAALMRSALAPSNAALIPEVYGWNAFSEGKGWSLIQHMPGTPLQGKFDTLGAEKQEDLLGQIAQVFRQFRDYKLPASVRGYGGLNFDDEGNIIVGATPIAGGGPSATLPALYTEYFQTQLGFADKCDVVGGWKNTDLRERLDKFAAAGLEPLLENIEGFEPRPTLVHADFDVNNMLFDEGTNRLTAILDYDFSHVGSQADEYFYSLGSLQGLLVPPFEEDEEAVQLRECHLHGFDEAAASRASSDAVNWKLAVLLDEALAKAGVERPQDIPGMDTLSALYWFIQDVSPPYFFLPRWRARQTPEKIQKIRGGVEENLKRYLDGWGY